VTHNKNLKVKPMKTGMNLVEMATELSRIAETKKDYIVPVEKMQAVVKDDKLAIEFENGHINQYPVNDWSGSQLATFSDIPKSYFDRISSENPELMAKNVNHALERIVAKAKTERRTESRLIRTLDGNVRGLMSSRYRILDSHDMLEAIYPTFIEKGLKIESSAVTDKRLFIKAVSPALKSEIKQGDVVQYGITISTSDVGAGSVRVEPLIYRLVCKNGLIMPSAIRKMHIGKNQTESDVYELLSDSTKHLTDTAFWAQVRDVVLASLKPENFEAQVDRLRVAAGEEIKNFDLPRVVELTMRATGLTGDGKKNSILAALASGNEGAGLTKWGLINSFTRAAQDDAIDYEESVEMERAAGLILDLAPSQWKTISTVAA
jgi:hypothetical protein